MVCYMNRLYPLYSIKAYFIPIEEKIMLMGFVNKQRRVPCVTNGVFTTPLSKGETHKIPQSDIRSVKYLLCQKLKITVIQSLFTRGERHHQLPIINESINQLCLSHKLVEFNYAYHLHPPQYSEFVFKKGRMYKMNLLLHLIRRCIFLRFYLEK